MRTPDLTSWHPASWTSRPAQQQPRYTDPSKLESNVAALAKLPPRPRLLLRLRYQQELTLEEVARLVGLPDPYRTHREIQAAVEALGRQLPPAGR